MCLDNEKDIYEKIFKKASNFSKKAESVVKIGENKINIKLIEKEIEKRKLYLGDCIYKWYSSSQIQIDEVLRVCKEIKELKEKIDKINKKILNQKE